MRRKENLREGRKEKRKVKGNNMKKKTKDSYGLEETKEQITQGRLCLF